MVSGGAARGATGPVSDTLVGMQTPQELVDDPMFPWGRDLQVKSLEPPVVPEPPRHGETTEDCGSCGRPDSDYLWTDEHWRLSAVTHVPLRGAVLLETRVHCDSFADMPAPVAADLGPVMGATERAILSIGEVGRVHTVRWGDGGAHFHQWFLPRPLGALQMRGQALMFWIEVLPPVADDVRDRAHREVAAALRAERAG
jgi:hypothetical protein